MNTRDVEVEVAAPARWARVQLLMRLALLALLSLLSARAGWVLALVYWALPIIAAVSIQRVGARHYPGQNGRSVRRWLHWWTAIAAYMLFATDRFPASSEDVAAVRFTVSPSGQVDFLHALLRLFTSLPELVVVLALAVPASLLAVVAAAFVLFTERVPRPVLRYQRYYIALQGRWLAYHASLVDAHPLSVVRTYQAH